MDERYLGSEMARGGTSTWRCLQNKRREIQELDKGEEGAFDSKAGESEDAACRLSRDEGVKGERYSSDPSARPS